MSIILGGAMVAGYCEQAIGVPTKNDQIGWHNRLVVRVPKDDGLTCARCFLSPPLPETT